MTVTSDDYRNRCFLCLRETGDGLQRTEEDVIPKWLIRHAGLSTTRSVLPNGRLFRYAERTVPACEPCNQHLSRELEQPVSQAVRDGFAAVQALDPKIVLMWLAKIYYGTRWRELALRTDVADPHSPFMLSIEELTGRAEYLRRLLLSGPNRTEWRKPLGSLFLYRSGVPNVPEHRFDFFVPDGNELVALRINDVFLIATFGDNGHWQTAIGESPRATDLRQLELHPVQCSEVMLRIHSMIAMYRFTGCWDIMYVGDPRLPGGASSIFMPSFVLEPSGAPQPLLNELFLAAFMQRAMTIPTDERLLAGAREGRLPTAVYNVEQEHPVQATCFELQCPAVWQAAGWQFRSDQAPCENCGSQAPAPDDSPPA